MKSRNWVVIFFFIIFSFFVFTTISVYSVYNNLIKLRKSNNEKNELSTYLQYMSLNPQTRESSFGIVSLPNNDNDEEENNDFISYRNEVGNYILISPFGSQEFECTGSCYCEEETDEHARRASGTYLSGSSRTIVTYLVAAFSSLVAFELASDYFNNFCTDQLVGLETCEGSGKTVRSEIIDCSPFFDEKPFHEKRTGRFRIKDLTEEILGPPRKIHFLHKHRKVKFDDKNREFMCAGKCVPNNQIKREKLRTQAKEYGCGKIGAKSKVHVQVNELRKFDGHVLKRFNEAAVLRFQEKFDEFCRRETTEEIVEDIRDKIGEEYEDGRITMCVGKLAKRYEHIENIKCRQIDPPVKKKLEGFGFL